MVHFVGAGPGAPDLITRRGAALLARAEADAGEDASWQSHLDAGRRQLADLNAKYETAKNAEAEARRAYLHHLCGQSGEPGPAGPCKGRLRHL